MNNEMGAQSALGTSPPPKGTKDAGCEQRDAVVTSSGTTSESSLFQPTLFRGIDTVDNEPLDTVVTGSEDVEEYPSGTSTTGGTSWSSYRAVTTYEELCDTLCISAKATATFGATGSATAKMTFAEDFEMTTYCVAAVAYSRRCEKTVQATAYNFIDEKTFDLINGDGADPGGFAKVHGDSWVNAVSMGGEYYAVYMFYCQSVEQQQEISAKLKGDYSGGTVEASASFKMALDSALSTHVSETRFEQRVSGDPSEPVPTSPDDMATYAQRFPSLTMTNPVVFDYSVLGYEETTYDGKIPSSFGQIVENRTKLMEVQGSYAQQLADLEAFINQCNSLVGTAAGSGNPGIYRFYGHGDDAVTDALAQAEAARKAISDLFAQYENDPACVIEQPPELDSMEKSSLELGPPALSVSYEQCALAGTSGHGQYFNDLDQDGLGDFYCNNHRRVAKIAMYNNDDGIGLLETTYHDPTGTSTYEVTYQRGSGDYKTTVYHEFAADETITKIEVYSAERRMHNGKHWTCVTAIVITYTTGAGISKTLRSSSGFYDKCNITTYEFGTRTVKKADGSTISTRTVFIGWDGYAADTHVYGLRPIQAVLQPATWPNQK